ncbi:MAG TPA: alkaline phosphatase, partial [Burkholderiales bacterium]
MTSPSRRRVLEMIAGAPLLPIASSFAGMLPAVAQAATLSGRNLSVSFTSMPAPGLADAAAMATTTVGSSIEVRHGRAVNQYKLQYESFFVTGTMVPDGKGGVMLAGGYYDINGKPIMDASGSESRQFFSDSPDGSTLLTLKNARVPGVKGNHVFAVVQFEYTTRDLAGGSQYAKLPSPFAVLTLDQDPKTGALSLVKYHNVDTSSVHGVWISCGASRSPWNT